MKKKNLRSDLAEESRNTTAQTTTYIDDDGVIRYNKRKITELPGFIAQMTPNISYPLAAKHVFFNYEFLSGLFACISVPEIFEAMQKYSSGSSYSLSEEARIALTELNYLNILFYQCMISMSDHANSVSVQILSRVLIFYGYLPYLTDFIKQSDKYSKNQCALLAPYQSLLPPGMGPLFALEKHSRPIHSAIFANKSPLIFTLSTKIHAINLNELDDLGEIELPKLNEPDYFKQMIVYFEKIPDDNVKQFKLIKGRVIVISSNCLFSINFDSNEIFIKMFEHTKIKSISQISQRHVLVVFDQEKYFEIYDFYTGELVLIQKFDLIIKCAPCDNSSVTNEEHINGRNVYFSDLKICIVLENSEIKILSLNKDEREIKISEMITIQSPGIECIDACYSKSSDQNAYFSFNDGSLLISNEYFESFVFVKPKLKEPKSNLTVRYLNTGNKGLILLLGNDQFIYFCDSNHIIKLADQKKYSDAIFCEDFTVGCVSKGVIDIYRIHKDEINAYQGVFMMSFDAHFMDITCFQKKGKT